MRLIALEQAVADLQNFGENGESPAEYVRLHKRKEYLLDSINKGYRRAKLFVKEMEL